MITHGITLRAARLGRCHIGSVQNAGREANASRDDPAAASRNKERRLGLQDVTLEDLLLLEAVGEKRFDQIMRARRKKAKRASINKDDKK